MPKYHVTLTVEIQALNVEAENEDAAEVAGQKFVEANITTSDDLEVLSWDTAEVEEAGDE